MKSNIDRPLAAILTLNTIAHTVGAAGVGAKSAHVFGSSAVGIASAIMTFAILIFSEIIPKTLGAVHAKRLAPVTYYATMGMIWLCYPLIIMLEWTNRLIGYQHRKEHISRMEILATIQLGGQAGTLGKREFNIARNVLALRDIQLDSIMTPRTVVFALPASTTVAEVLAEHQPISFARIPIFDTSLDDIVGYIPRFDIREAAAEGKHQLTMAELARPMVILPELSTVSKAMHTMLDQDEHIAAVVDEYGGLEGIVTLEDIMETLLGQEIIDETHTDADMQHVARTKSQLTPTVTEP